MNTRKLLKDDNFLEYRFKNWQHIINYAMIACSVGSVLWVIKDVLISGFQKAGVSTLCRSIPALFLLVYLKFRNKKNFLCLASIHIWLAVVGVVFIYWSAASVGEFATSGTGWLMFLTLFFVVSIFSGITYILINYISMFAFIIILYQVFPTSLSVSHGEAYFTYILVSVGYILVNFFISRMFKEMYTYQRKLYEYSYTDQLTKIPNRHILKDIVPNNRLQTNATIVVVDIDKFKDINDTFGHNAGDEALITSANVLLGSFRKGQDTVIRYGGDEFLVICEGEIDIDKVHERLKESLKVGNPYNISFSIGVSLGKEGESIYDVIKRADCALYAVKVEGRNNLKIFENI